MMVVWIIFLFLYTVLHTLYVVFTVIANFTDLFDELKDIALVSNLVFPIKDLLTC